MTSGCKGKENKNKKIIVCGKNSVSFHCALLCFIVLYCALLCFIVLIILNFALRFLKGVFAKNERVYSFTSKNYRWLLILLLSVASLMRKWLKTTYTEERSVHTNSAS